MLQPKNIVAQASGLAFLALLLPNLQAQNPGPPETVIAIPEVHRATDLMVPPLPRVMAEIAPIGGLPTVPTVDGGLPQPNSRPCVIGNLQAQPAAGQFTVFRNRDHRPAGAGILHPGEPSAAASRDTYFATGNTYGSLSKDSGMTWSYVNPYTLFPASDGGVCCDQRVIADPASGLLLWYIQYRYSATTGNGGFRLAWARNRNDLRNGVWSSIYLNGASFGLAGNWLDFPDIAVSDAHVYIATNVFTASSAYQDSIVMRMSLSSIAQGSSIVTSYYKRNSGGSPMGSGASYRFAQTYNGGPAVEMFWAAHNNTSSLRIYRWDDANSTRYSDVDRTIPTWTSGTGSAPGPDGRDWIGFDDHRIASGYINPVFNEGAFFWTSNGNGGTRPQSYVRAQVFNPADRSIIATEDVFNGTFDFAYPAVGMSSLGHGAMVMSGGSPTTNVTTYAMISDNYTPFFQGGTIYALATGSNGAPSNRWGDYHSVVANSIDPRTWIVTGMNMSGGTGTGNTVHRTAWLGRDDYTPAWVALNVASTGVAGVAITVDETDRNGLKNGATPFARSYTPQQGYTLRAPASVASGSNTYLFSNWTGSGGTSASVDYTVASIGTSTQSATANYGLQSVVTVDDRNVAAGVSITASSLDLDGLGNGTTRFTRRYRASDGPFTFTAPALVGQQPFRRWYLNSVAQAIGQRGLTLAPSASTVTIEAEYCSYAAGAFAAYGSGCAGSNAVVPALSSASQPNIGGSVTHNLVGLTGPTPAVMNLGFSRTLWNGVPLPLSLGLFGANPACNLLAEPLVTLAMVIGGTGSGSLSLALPNDPNSIGVHAYTQVIAVDIFVPFPTKLVVSNGLDMLIGGSSIGGITCP